MNAAATTESPCPARHSAGSCPGTPAPRTSAPGPSRRRTAEPRISNTVTGVAASDRHAECRRALSQDFRVLTTHRRLESRARPGECDVTVVEGIDANFDAIGSGRLDIGATALRGCREELGVEVSARDVSILAFGVDMTYYQWNFMGMVEIKLTADEVMAQHALHAKDRWEGKVEPVKLDAVSVFERMRQEKIWDCGLVTAYLALSKKCGAGSTREAAERVFGFPK